MVLESGIFVEVALEALSSLRLSSSDLSLTFINEVCLQDFKGGIFERSRVVESAPYIIIILFTITIPTSFGSEHGVIRKLSVY